MEWLRAWRPFAKAGLPFLVVSVACLVLGDLVFLCSVPSISAVATFALVEEAVFVVLATIVVTALALHRPVSRQGFAANRPAIERVGAEKRAAVTEVLRAVFADGEPRSIDAVRAGAAAGS